MTDEVDRFHSTISLDLTQFLMRTLKPAGFFFIRRQSCLEQVRRPPLPDVHTRRAVIIVAFTSTGARNTSFATVIINSARYAVTFIEEFHFRRKLT